MVYNKVVTLANGRRIGIDRWGIARYYWQYFKRDQQVWSRFFIWDATVASQIKETVDLDESLSFFGKIKALKTNKIAVILRAEWNFV